MAQNPGFDAVLGFLWLQQNTVTKKQVGEGRVVVVVGFFFYFLAYISCS